MVLSKVCNIIVVTLDTEYNFKLWLLVEELYVQLAFCNIFYSKDILYIKRHFCLTSEEPGVAKIFSIRKSPATFYIAGPLPFLKPTLPPSA